MTEIGPIDWRGSDRCTVLAVETSNRHVHLSAGDLERLFGVDHELTMARGLAGMPDDVARLAGFASTDTVHVVNPANGKALKNVRILGPCRDLTQVELAFTDCRALGINAPTRISGDTVNSAPCRLVNPATGAFINIPEGVIRAWRHVHVSHAQAYALDISDRDLLIVKITCPGNTVTYEDVMVRILHGMSDALRIELARRGVELRMLVHLDTDESNAAMLQDATAVELFKPRPDGTLLSLIRNEGSIETNASRRNGKTAWSQAEAKPRPGGILPPTKPLQMSVQIQSKL